ncbi:MAG: hypothetical protein HC841_03465, partial [Verrucomicrobiae bacterium]|nr:hypothetical protein [Verrucomicrobiae bacterium]
MAIKGRTDRASWTGQGLPLLGRLYKGGRRSQEDIARNRPGPDLDHFRFEPADRYAALIGDAFEQVYKPRPVEIKEVYAFGDSVEGAFETWMEEWARSGLLRRCDGETMTNWYNPANARVMSTPKPCEPDVCKCKPLGRMRLVLPALMQYTGVFGYVQLTTHSQIEIDRITARLFALEA